MSDTPERKARLRQLLQEIQELEQEIGPENEQLTIDEIVEITRQVRKEIAEERIKGEHK